MMRAALGSIVLVTLAGASVAGGAAGLGFDTPDGWVATTPSSSMRVAQFSLPRTGDDAEDATAIVYFFGGSGGSVEANLERWIGQIRQPDGSSSRSAARIVTMSSTAGLKLTVVDVSGTYVAEVTPGSTERYDKPNYRLRAAVVETPDGPYFVKLTGPQATLARWNESFLAFLRSMRTD